MIDGSYASIIDKVFGIPNEDLREIFSSDNWKKVVNDAEARLEKNSNTAYVVAYNKAIGEIIDSTMNCENSFADLMALKKGGSSEKLAEFLHVFLEKYCG